MSEEPALVGAHTFLRGMPSDQIARLAAFARHVSLPSRQRLFEEGAAADRFWILDAGQVALDVLVPGVGRRVLETLGRGDVLGLSWLVSPYQWQFGATCTQPTQAVEFDGCAVKAACATDPAFGYALAMRFMTVAAHRLQVTRGRLLRATEFVEWAS